MLRTDGDPEVRVFDPVIRFLHWVTLFLIAAIFVLAFSVRFATSSEAARTLIELTAGVCCEGSPSGRPQRTRTCCSNWEVRQASMV